MAPRGWSVTTEDRRVLLRAADGDASIVVVEGIDADDPQEAVNALRLELDPDGERRTATERRRPGRHGWDEARSFVFDGVGAKGSALHADAFRKASSWAVVFVRATPAALEKRASAVKLVLDSLRPAGTTRETFIGRAPRALDATRIAAIEQFIALAQKEAGIPGVAISLFTADRVLVEEGFGVRTLGAPERVDPDTLFLIASNTKQLTTLLLATLVDAGRFAWDSKVTSVYPAFRLADTMTTSKMEMRHLVCACTGLPRQDLEWLLGFRGSSAESTLALVASMRPTSGFGEVYQYSNVLASAAGFIAGAVVFPGTELGAAYDRAITERVFAPLGMTRTTLDFSRALADNHAAPHEEDAQGSPAVAMIDVDRAIIPLRPAGGAWSSAADLRRYVQMELALGRLPGGRALVSEENLLARRAPEVRMGADEAYGMGLRVNTEYGVPYVHHGGGLIGYKSDVFWIPSVGLGGVLLTNSSSGGLLLHPFVRKVFEELYDGASEVDDDVTSASRERRERLDEERATRELPASPAAVHALAPTYRNDALGLVRFSTDGRGTHVETGLWTSLVASRRHDDGTFSLLTVDTGASGFEFLVDPRVSPARLVMRDAQHEYVFAPVP